MCPAHALLIAFQTGCLSRSMRITTWSSPPGAQRLTPPGSIARWQVEPLRT